MASTTKVVMVGNGVRTRGVGAWSRGKEGRKFIEVKKENWYLVFPLQSNAVRPASCTVTQVEHIAITEAELPSRIDSRANR